MFPPQGFPQKSQPIRSNRLNINIYIQTDKYLYIERRALFKRLSNINPSETYIHVHYKEIND